MTFPMRTARPVAEAVRLWSVFALLAFVLAGSLPAQQTTVLFENSTGALTRPAAATFRSANDIQSASGAAASYQPLSARLTSWAAITRASGFDTFTATPSSANLISLLTDETGTGAAVFANTPTLVTPNIGAATGTSLNLSGGITLGGDITDTGPVTISAVGNVTLSPSAGNIVTTARRFTVTDATASTSTTTGSATFAGGVGVAGAAFFGGQVVAPGGSAASPGLTFSSDTGTGFYRKSTNSVGYTTNGTLRGYWDQFGNWLRVAVSGGWSMQALAVRNAADAATLGGIGVKGTNDTLEEVWFGPDFGGSAWARVESTGLVVVATTASTSTTTGSGRFAGGIGVAGRTSTATLNVGGTNGTTSDLIASATATVDYTSIAAGTEQTQTITVTGAAVGDSVSLGWGAVLPDGIVVKQYWVSATNTVSIRVRNETAGAIDPASQTVRATVISF